VDCSEITPNPAEWWLRPVIRPARVGEHSTVENKRSYRNPFLVTRRPPGPGLQSSVLDHTAEGRRWRWQLVATDRGGGVGGPERAGDRLGQHGRSARLPAHQPRRQDHGHGRRSRPVAPLAPNQPRMVPTQRTGCWSGDQSRRASAVVRVVAAAGVVMGAARRKPMWEVPVSGLWASRAAGR
jgi:hypothetical protein